MPLNGIGPLSHRAPQPPGAGDKTLVWEQLGPAFLAPVPRSQPVPIGASWVTASFPALRGPCDVAPVLAALWTP